MDQATEIEATDPSGAPLLAARAITKRFGDFVANDRVDLDLARGEIHALLGENGAGKSTLVKILYGLLSPTEGEILWRGEPVVLPSPNAARALGIGMVFQHFSLFDNLTVAENVALALPKTERLETLPDRIAEISRAYGFSLEPGRPVYSLSAGERQRIEIARCLLQDPKALILDEPTSVLTPQEAERLFETLRRLKAEGRAVLYISHHLEEVQRLCDRATILRLGKVVASCDPGAETARSLAALMVGAQINDVRADEGRQPGEPRLVVDRLSAASPSQHGVSLKNVSLTVRAGEVVGVAGVAGNGQSELFACLSGELIADRPDAIYIDGHAVGDVGVHGRRARQRRLRARGAQRPRRRARLQPVGERRPHQPRQARDDARRLHRRRSRAGQGRRGRRLVRRAQVRDSTRSPARCRAETCKNSSSAARFSPIPASSSSTSRPGASTRSPRRRSARRCSTFPPKALRCW